jgi:hypothetical protein
MYILNKKTVLKFAALNLELYSSSSWVLQLDSSQDRLNYASPPDPIRRCFFPVSNPQCKSFCLLGR